MKALAFLCVLLLSCASVCDTIDGGDSKLCSIADEYGVNLSVAGKSIEVANGLAIGRGYYTNAQALEVATALRGVLDGPVTWGVWNTNIKLYAAKYPAIFKDLDLSVLDSLVLDALLTPTDKRILSDFFDRVLASLSVTTA